LLLPTHPMRSRTGVRQHFYGFVFVMPAGMRPSKG
jgi:hypothetical protein